MRIDKAVVALREGKVRYKHWIDCKYVQVKDGYLMDDKGHLTRLCVWEEKDIVSDNWEIVEEEQCIAKYAIFLLTLIQETYIIVV